MASVPPLPLIVSTSWQKLDTQLESIYHTLCLKTRCFHLPFVVLHMVNDWCRPCIQKLWSVFRLPVILCTSIGYKYHNKWLLLYPGIQKMESCWWLLHPHYLFQMKTIGVGSVDFDIFKAICPFIFLLVPLGSLPSRQDHSVVLKNFILHVLQKKFLP